MERILILKGCAGLGNRLITLYSAIRYCIKTHRKLYVDWSDGMFEDKGKNAFFEFFELKGVEHSENLKEVYLAVDNHASIYPRTMTDDELSKGIYENWHVVGSYLAKHSPLYRVVIGKFVVGKVSSLFGLRSWQRKADNSKVFLTLLKKYIMKIISC